MIPSDPQIITNKGSKRLFPAMKKTVSTSYSLEQEDNNPPLSIGRHLEELNAATLDNRIPLVVYDSLRNVEFLQTMLSGEYIIPIFRGVLMDAEIVFAPNGQRTLYESHNAQTQISVLMLEDTQLAVLDKEYNKEEEYDLFKLNHAVLIGSGKVELKNAYTYLHTRGALAEGKKPIRPKDTITLTGKFPVRAESEIKSILNKNEYLFPKLRGEVISL